MVEVESLILDAEVVDNFSKELDELAKGLMEIDAQEDKTFPTDSDVRIAEAMADMQALEERIRSLDDEEINIDTDVDSRREREFGSPFTEQMDKDMDRLSDRIKRLGEEEEVNVDMELRTHDARSELELLELRLERLESDDVDIEVNADVADAMTKMTAARGMLAAFDDENIDTDISTFSDIRGKIEGAEAELDQLDGGDFDARARRAIQRAGVTPGGGDLEMSIDEAFDMPGGRGEDRFNLPRFGFSRLGRKLDDIVPNMEKFDGGLRNSVRRFSKLNVSMGMFMNIFATFIPLLFVFIGALPAAIAGLGALAVAALAAVGALGVVGGLAIGAMLFEGGELNVAEAQEHLREVLDTFIESFRPLMEALKPVAESLFRNLQFVIRDVASRMDVLLSLSDEMQGAFRWVAQVAGPAMQELVLFSEAAMPILAGLVEWGANIDWFGLFAQIIVDTLPLLSTFGLAIADMAWEVYQMSLGFFQVVNIITLFITTFLNLLNIIPGGAQMFGILVGLLLTLVTVTALWSRLTGNLMRHLMTLVADAIMPYILAAFQVIAETYGMAAAFTAAAVAAGTFMAVLTFGVAPLLTSVLGTIAGVNTQMSGAADQMKRFRREADRVGPVGGPGRAADGPRYRQPGAGTTVVAPDQETGNAVANTISWQNRQSSDTTNNSDVENYQHSR